MSRPLPCGCSPGNSYCHAAAELYGKMIAADHVHEREGTTATLRQAQDCRVAFLEHTEPTGNLVLAAHRPGKPARRVYTWQEHDQQLITSLVAMAAYVRAQPYFRLAGMATVAEKAAERMAELVEDAKARVPA